MEVMPLHNSLPCGRENFYLQIENFNHPRAEGNIAVGNSGKKCFRQLLTCTLSLCAVRERQAVSPGQAQPRQGAAPRSTAVPGWWERWVQLAAQ